MDGNMQDLSPVPDLMTFFKQSCNVKLTVADTLPTSTCWALLKEE